MQSRLNSQWGLLFKNFEKEWSNSATSFDEEIKELSLQQDQSPHQKIPKGIAFLETKRDKNKTHLTDQLLRDIRKLKEKGADVNARISPDTTLLMYAFTNNDKYQNIIHPLLELGTHQTINTNNNQGLTALAMAVNKGYPGLVKLLLSYGTTVQAINNPQKTSSTEKFIADNRFKNLYEILELKSDASSQDVENARSRLLGDYDSTTTDTALKDYKKENLSNPMNYTKFSQQRIQKCQIAKHAYLHLRVLMASTDVSYISKIPQINAHFKP
jgi:ankyrin repeat protein